MLNANFAILGAIVNLFGCYSYTKNTLQGKNKPNRVSWALWAVAPLVAFAAELSQKVGPQSFITFSAGLGPLIILSASFVDKKAYWKITPFDAVCGALSVLAFILWSLTGKGNIAILLSILADLLACLPTIAKAYRHPATESAGPFIAGVIGVIITILTIRTWTFANYAFPFYLLLANSVIAATVLLRTRDLAAKKC